MRSSILGVICLTCGVVVMTTGGDDRPREAAGLDGGRPVLAASGRHSATASPQEPAYLGRAIRDVRVGQRVIAEKPQIGDAERAAFGAEPDEATWRRLTLRMTKGDGRAGPAGVGRAGAGRGAALRGLLWAVGYSVTSRQ